MRRANIALLAFAGCATASRPTAPTATPPPPRQIDIYGSFESPAPLTVSLVAADGSVAGTGTIPTGGYQFHAWPGSYELRFVDPGGADLSGCTLKLEVAPVRVGQINVNERPLPARCPLQLWKSVDRNHPSAESRGTRSEFKTAFGDHEGYRLLPCDEHSVDIAFVVGNGSSRPPENADRKHDAELDAWIDRERAAIARALEPMGSGAGYGKQCRDKQVGIIVYVSDWHQADEAVARLARVIHDDDLGIGMTLALIQSGTAL